MGDGKNGRGWSLMTPQEMMEAMKKEMARRSGYDIKVVCPHCASMDRSDIKSQVVDGEFWVCNECRCMWNPKDGGSHYDAGYIRHPFTCFTESAYHNMEG